MERIGGGRHTRRTLLAERDLIKTALLEADVEYSAAKNIATRVMETLSTIKMRGEDRKKAVAGAFFDVLKGTFSVAGAEELRGRVMIVGVNGAGKTTTTGKLARWMQSGGVKATCVPCDYRRAAAAEQLGKLCKEAGVEFISQKDGVSLFDFILGAKREAHGEVVFFDMAGRQTPEAGLLEELRECYKIINPAKVILVVDAATGQQAKPIAEEFNRVAKIDSVIITKTDGDALGGAVLTVAEGLRVPVLFVGTGEKPDDLEKFSGERWARRILGQGEMAELARVAESIGASSGEEDMNLEGFLRYLKGVQSVGGMLALTRFLPGSSARNFKWQEKLRDEAVFFKKAEAIILSMTPEERATPSLVEEQNRVFRIAGGAGVDDSDVREFLGRFEHMKALLR